MSPLAVHMYLTTLCNLACTHCYYDAKRTGEEAGKLLTTAEAAQIIEFLSSNFDADLHLEGGEMFLRDDIEEILTRVPAKRHKSLTFTTSGTVPIRVSPSLLKGIGELRISVEGHNEALQQRMRPANLVRVRRTIDELLSNDVDFTLRVTLFRDNASVLEEMIDAFMGWGVRRLSLFEFQPVGRGEQHVDEYSLSDSQFAEVLSTLAGMPLPNKLELLKLNLSSKRTAFVQTLRPAFAAQGYQYLPLGAVPNLTINANGDLGISPWLATAAQLGDKFANLHEIDFATEIHRRLQAGDLSAFCPYTSALQMRYSRQ